MLGADKALLRHLLLIHGAWEIGDFQIDPRKRRCDVWITPQVERGWFGRPKSAPTKTQEYTWQHVNLGTLRFVLHVSVPIDTELPKLLWTGAVGLPFTNALALQVQALSNEGVALQIICSAMKLSLSDVWRYRFAQDNARAQGQGAAIAAATSAAAKPPTTASVPTAGPAAAATVGRVPDASDPVWLRLVNGELPLDIHALGLKLMLTRVRSQLELVTDESGRQLKLRDLHRFFLMNERVLTHELTQLKAG